MGLASELSYVHQRPNVAQRMVQAVASTRPGAWLFARIAARFDRAAGRLTSGRRSVVEVVAGLPAVQLSTTGRKSGQRRQTHLIGIPIGDTLALLGTNFGQARTPAWVLNLEADPRATVTYRDTAREVVARPATDPERAQVMAGSTGIYAGYVKYQHRITGRRVRIFVLEPADS